MRLDLSTKSNPGMQFEREDKQSAQKKTDGLISRYKLTSLASKPDIQPHLLEALAKVSLHMQAAALLHWVTMPPLQV